VCVGGKKKQNRVERRVENARILCIPRFTHYGALYFLSILELSIRSPSGHVNYDVWQHFFRNKHPTSTKTKEMCGADIMVTTLNLE
jgi:hypothetical protein